MVARSSPAADGVYLGLGCGGLRGLDRIWPMEACYSGGPSSRVAQVMMLIGPNSSHLTEVGLVPAGI